MDEMERRLRAAMTAAAEQAPPGLMEGIRRRHRRHLRRIGVGCVAAAAIAAVSPSLLHALTAAPPPPGPVFTGPTVTPSPTAVPGTMLLACSAANWGQLPSNWRAESLKISSLWLVDGRQFGYVHHVASASEGNVYGHGKVRDGVMIVEVTDGSTVVMKAAPEVRPYFRLVAGFNGPTPNELPRGDTGFTFIACPRGAAGPNGLVTDFYLGFLIKAGSAASVDVWTPGQPRASRVIFSCPGRGCEG